uniref:PLP-dependent transferase n=1 Tax=Actinotalea sp. Marseille-Q4924 TaxID=2866571 RepID=UPI001CE42609
LHSVTKYLAGHSDVVLGALATDDEALRARLASYRTLHGAVAGRGTDARASRSSSADAPASTGSAA